MSKMNIASAVFLALLAQCVSHAARAETAADPVGHVVRSRDSQPLAAASVQIAETSAKTTTDEHGAYSFNHLKPGVYTVIVSPGGGGPPVEHKVTLVAGNINREDFTVEGEMSALQQIAVLSQRAPIANFFQNSTSRANRIRRGHDRKIMASVWLDARVYIAIDRQCRALRTRESQG